MPPSRALCENCKGHFTPDPLEGLKLFSLPPLYNARSCLSAVPSVIEVAKACTSSALVGSAALQNDFERRSKQIIALSSPRLVNSKMQNQVDVDEGKLSLSTFLHAFVSLKK